MSVKNGIWESLVVHGSNGAGRINCAYGYCYIRVYVLFLVEGLYDMIVGDYSKEVTACVRGFERREEWGDWESLMCDFLIIYSLNYIC